MIYPGFFDLCINPEDSNKENLRRLLTRLYEMGYKNVAINQNLDESALEIGKKKRKKGENEPSKAILVPRDLTDIKEEFKDKINILRRLTFSFSDKAKTHHLEQQSSLKKFDLYSVLPKDKEALQHACSQVSADIITVDSSSKALKFTRKLYIQAVERGMHFEIKYVDAISPSTRNNAIYYSHLFHIYGKSKNVFISSGAKDYSMIRNPYDIITLAALFGLNENKAKAAVLSQCKHLVLRALGRRFGKTVFSIKISDDHESEDSDDSKEEDLLITKKIKMN